VFVSLHPFCLLKEICTDAFPDRIYTPGRRAAALNKLLTHLSDNLFFTPCSSRLSLIKFLNTNEQFHHDGVVACTPISNVNTEGFVLVRMPCSKHVSVHESKLFDTPKKAERHVAASISQLVAHEAAEEEVGTEQTQESVQQESDEEEENEDEAAESEANEDDGDGNQGDKEQSKQSDDQVTVSITHVLVATQLCYKTFLCFIRSSLFFRRS